MTKSNMKVESASLSEAAGRIHTAGAESKTTTAAALHGVAKLGASAGHKVFGALVDDIFDELKAKLPDDIALLVTSYANGLLDLQGATSATDEALAKRFGAASADASGAAGGLSAIAIGGLGSAGVVLQGGGGPSLQGGSISIQGQGSQGVSISTSPSDGAPTGGFQLLPTASKIGLGAGDANQATLDKYTAWLNDPNGGKVVRDRRGDSGDEVDCTTWAIWRRSQIDPGTHMTDQQLYWGNGIDVAGHFPQATAPDQIDVGSLISNGPGPNGHVMVVEEVIRRQPLQLRVSEGNVLGDFDSRTPNISTSTIVTYHGGNGAGFPDGSWTIQRPGRGVNNLAVVGTSLP